MSKLFRASMPACFASSDPLTHATESAAHCYLHRRVSMAKGAACCSKKAQTSPTIATTEAAPGAAAVGGHGDVLGASIDEGPAGQHRPACADRCQRLFAIASHSLGPMSSCFAVCPSPAAGRRGTPVRAGI